MHFDFLMVLIIIFSIVLFLIVKKYMKFKKTPSYVGMKYVKKDSPAKAVKYLKKAADANDPVCAYNLGIIYFEGKFALLNKVDATKYFKMGHDNCGKGDFAVSDRQKSTDPREKQNKRIKKNVKKIWELEELWRLDTSTSTVLNY